MNRRRLFPIRRLSHCFTDLHLWHDDFFHFIPFWLNKVASMNDVLSYLCNSRSFLHSVRSNFSVVWHIIGQMICLLRSTDEMSVDSTSNIDISTVRRSLKWFESEKMPKGRNVAVFFLSVYILYDMYFPREEQTKDKERRIERKDRQTDASNEIGYLITAAEFNWHHSKSSRMTEATV